MQQKKRAIIMEMKLEVVVVPVSDVDRAKAFYEKLGFRLDIDFSKDDFRVVQFTPPGSQASIHIGKGLTSAAAGSLRNLYLVVFDVEEARTDLVGRGVDVSEVYHYAGLGVPGRLPGADPERQSYASFASFSDPDGNIWLLQEIQARLPGRVQSSPSAQAMDVAALAELLRETGERHGQFEKTHAEHHWWDWYAPYLQARQNGGSPEEAVAVAESHMEVVLGATASAGA
ncbi:MAG: Glyoxalase/bleomycin resistance protein/dioxygenase [Capsulimonas sp.]|jgi:catechol 2,3-dioxygenase-like lactoylglutathione lyase family enzyme|nr:Glyoxalase/bleomycin resistance protein/dioxygenase [Capsulimonas sp.]